jgi:hypothetical protein
MFLQKARDAKRIYATVVNAKTNCDGFKDKGISHPSGKMQSLLLRQCCEECGVNPSSVEYCEAHGTATKVCFIQDQTKISLLSIINYYVLIEWVSGGFGLGISSEFFSQSDLVSGFSVHISKLQHGEY